MASLLLIGRGYRGDQRDRLHALYPMYGFDKHKGYPTAAHFAALKEHGALPEHRRSFAPVKAVLVNPS